MKNIKVGGATIGEIDENNNKVEDVQRLCTSSFEFGRTIGIFFTSVALIVPSVLVYGIVEQVKYTKKNKTAIIFDKDQNKATIFNIPGEIGYSSFKIFPSPIDDGNDTFKYVGANGVKVTGYIRTGEGDRYKEDVKGSIIDVVYEAEKLIGPDGTVEFIDRNTGKARTISKK